MYAYFKRLDYFSTGGPGLAWEGWMGAVPAARVDVARCMGHVAGQRWMCLLLAGWPGMPAPTGCCTAACHPAAASLSPLLPCPMLPACLPACRCLPAAECIYAPFAARGFAREFVKDLEVGWGSERALPVPSALG